MAGLLAVLCMLHIAVSSASNARVGQKTKLYCVAESKDFEHFSQRYNCSETHTLSYYMSNSLKYFNSDETYVFQQGLHTAGDTQRTTISNVENISFIGPDETGNSVGAIINCNQSSIGFLFNMSSNIHIENITFYACLAKFGHVKKSVLTFLNVSQISLFGIKFVGTVGRAYAFEDVMGDIFLENIVVQDSASSTMKKLGNAANTITLNKLSGGKLFQATQIYIKNSKFANNFINHSNDLCAAVFTFDISRPGVQVEIYNISMVNNTGSYKGANLAICYLSPSTGNFNVSFEIRNSHFEGGKTVEGGGLFVLINIHENDIAMCQATNKEHNFLYVQNTNFVNNSARYAGGGAYLKLHVTSSPSPCGNVEKIVFENVTFDKNSVKKTGTGGIAFHAANFIPDYLHHLTPTYHVLLNNCTLQNNYYTRYWRDGSGTAVIVITTIQYFHLKDTAIFNNNATGIEAVNSNIILSRNVTIASNTGSSGGGLSLCQKSVIFLDENTNVSIVKNTARHTGGGIFVDAVCLLSQPVCFFQTVEDVPVLPTSINVSVHSNSARFAGNNIFGGSIDNCFMLKRPYRTKSTDMFKAMFSVSYDSLSISSPPRRVCLCDKNDTIKCDPVHFNNIVDRYHKLESFPGETFPIRAVLVGQFNGNVPGTVQAWLYPKHTAIFAAHENIQKIQTRNCTELNYTIYTQTSNINLTLGAQLTGDIGGMEQLGVLFQKIRFSVKLKRCPLGFSLSNRAKPSCECCSLFLYHNNRVSCNIKNQIIKRVPPAWIGFIKQNNRSIVAYHTHCPIDYCKSTDSYLQSTEHFIDQDQQCAFNRTGILCGSCPPGLSSVLGSSECQQCSNYWLLLVIPFALVGVVMVTMLTLLNITIADGTLSGIVFYCNIVGNNLSIFFHRQNIPLLTSLLKAFVLMINLDTGMTLCFFDGMDAYIISWLNFAFPLYLWLLTGLLICLGDKCSWIIRHNAVKVLATLVLFSYARLLSAVAGALQVSHVDLQLQNKSIELRWLSDGNVKYFEGKHIPLAAFAILFSLLLLPFALSLSFIQCLQKVSHYRAFSWVNYLKPFFDVYTGPFTASGRFWTGLLLLSRGVLFAVTAVNTSGNPGTVLGATTFTVIVLLLVAWILPAGLYRNRPLNRLECSSLVNLGILGSLLFIFEKKTIYSTIISHLCVSIALVTFICIIIYHIVSLKSIKNTIKRSCCYQKIAQYCNGFVWNNNAVHRDEFDDMMVANFPEHHVFAEDREPLLATNTNN